MKKIRRWMLAGAAALAGCATMGGGGSGSTVRLSASPTVPAAQGSVSVGKGKNGNASLDVNVDHLAQPDRLTPPANVYVVWLQPQNGAPPQNIGALTVDKDLHGKLDTVTAFRRFDLEITPEASSDVQQPTGKPLLWGSYSG